MQKLGIALCITDLRLGGAERCLVELALAMDRRRFDPVVYSLQEAAETETVSAVPLFRGAGIEVHCLDARRYWHLPDVLRRLTRLLCAQKPQIIQTFLFHANLLGRIAARRAGVPYVVSGIRVGETSRRWRLYTDRLTNHLVDRHVCVSQSVARFAKTQVHLPVEKLVVIPNGIDLRNYTTVEPVELGILGIAEGHRVVVCVGRLDRQKGQQWLIRSAPAWLAKVPDTELLLVGEGPKRKQLQRLARQTGLAERIHFAGWRSDVPRILAACDLLVLPSMWEGMPNVVLEAMASRLPVVATDVEGVRELLGPATDQQTVHYGDSAALAERIVALLGDRALAAELGAANRRRSEETYTISSMVDAYERLWESLLAD